MKGSCESRSKNQKDELAACLAAEKEEKTPDIAMCYRLFSFCHMKCRFPTQICGHESICDWADGVS